jgi:hypothetical protein
MECNDKITAWTDVLEVWPKSREARHLPVLHGSAKRESRKYKRMALLMLIFWDVTSNALLYYYTPMTESSFGR